MSTPTAPIKTPLGEEELRGRALRLGQRHRTILLLVDGHRPLDEVLSLASQAGAASSHLDELVKLGLVRLPVVEAETAPVQAHATTDEVAETAAVLPDREVPPSPSVAQPAQALDEQAAQPLPAQAPAAPASRAAAVKPRGKARRKPAAASATLEPLPADALQPAPKPSADKRRRSPASRPSGVSAAPAGEVDDPTVQQQVRDLLIDTLRLDTPLFSARMLVKVHGAQSAAELIDLVWEIQTHLRHDRHSHDELQSLHKARELLGMGNTHVDGESQAGALDD